MPIYEYECRKCKAHIEVFQKVNDKPPAKCRKCGGRLERLISAPAIQFKGSGWYVTDYSDKSKQSAAKADAESGSSEDKKTDKKIKDTSPATKTTDKTSSPKTSSD
jgi:putative FmdB family regulatory protein